MKIVICGGGSQGTVCAAVLASQEGIDVSILTNHPAAWSTSVTATDGNGRQYEGRLTEVTSEAKVVEGADIVLLTVPGFLIEKTLNDIKPWLSPKTAVGSVVSSTGFFFFAHDILPSSTPLFGFQRVPYIARVSEYGHHGLLLGYKPSLAVALEGFEDAEGMKETLQRMFSTPVIILGSHYEASLTNSNPILHTGRLWNLWKDWNGETAAECSLFYKEWDTASAQTIINMDEEFQHLLHTLGVKEGAIPTLLDYYESHDADSLASKLRSIVAFQNIKSPMKETEGGWIPDFSSRYFAEDFPYGLHFIKELAKEYSIPTPTINKVYDWGMRVIGR